MSPNPCSVMSVEPGTPPGGITVGCNRVTFHVHAASLVTEYTLLYFSEVWPIRFASLASDPDGDFSVSIPPASVAFPVAVWLDPVTPTVSFQMWAERMFPQSAWEKQSPECVFGVACGNVPIAPSARYQHSAVMYKTWNFVNDVLPHASLCKNGANSNSACTRTCLTDSTCFNPGFLNAAQSALPDKEVDSSQCPGSCCGGRTLCERTRDDLGEEIFFDETFLLIFGGKTKQKATVGPLDLYSNCEAILASPLSDADAAKYASCLEFQSEELWRYSSLRNVWELLKPRTLELKINENDVVYPPGRFGHAAAVVTFPAASDLQNLKRQYMFIFGGFSINCENGLCNDLWRYEIPWAAQAYWPPGYSGNVWKRMASCPFGGFVRHSMVATESGLLVFGGQKIGAYSNKIYVYTFSSDSWETKDGLGYSYFTRSVVDYSGATVTAHMSDLSQFVAGTDVLGPASSIGHVPSPRADHACTTRGNLMYIHGGSTYDENDLWELDMSTYTWRQVFSLSKTDSPAARRGSAIAFVPRANGAPLLVQFGGSRADASFNDTWTYDMSERKWQRIDTKWISNSFPPNTSFHSLSVDGNSVMVFGGLRWTQSNTTASDALTDADRRCLMLARAVLLVTCSGEEITAGSFATAAACAVAKAKADIRDQCLAASSTFCCSAVPQMATFLTLAAVSVACDSACTTAAFEPELTLTFSESLWVADLVQCEHGCSGHGSCELGICKCQPGWTGRDCSIPACVGGFCYFDADSLDQFCVACSGNGECGDDSACTCSTGWTGSDCATATTECAVTGQLLATEYPINQCVCDDRFSGTSCGTQLCLNGCNAKGNCTSGACQCEQGFYGDDCSVFLFTAGGRGASVALAIGVLLVSLLV